MVAVRELNLDGLPDGQRNWVNDHTVYTHGFGVVAAYGNQRRRRRASRSSSSRTSRRRAPSAPFEPRIYFGENSPDYSIVGGPAGGPQRELDYPDSSAAGQAEHHLRRQGRRAASGSLVRKAGRTRSSSAS